MLEYQKQSHLKSNLDEKYFFWKIKFAFDSLVAICLLPLLIIVAFFVTFLNFFFNKGSLFYVQKRMGKNCMPFHLIKFRTMKVTEIIERKFSDPLELNRITRLGQILRKCKIDELPQILNVIKGDMSLIGPRPDYYEHAVLFLENIPEYYKRHTIKPGISGLSQIRLGYAEGIGATKEKSKLDIYYIENANIILDIKIIFGTLIIILKALINKTAI